MKYPKGWNKTIEDLFKEERGISGEESEWAHAYERDQLGGDVRFPLNGEVYESTNDVETIYMTHWRAPFTGGEKFVLRKGIQIKVVVYEFNSEPIAVNASPIQYELLEKEIIPKEDRDDSKYSGYSLSIKTKTLNESFKLVCT